MQLSALISKEYSTVQYLLVYVFMHQNVEVDELKNVYKAHIYTLQ